MLEAWGSRPGAPKFEVIDTRGPGRLDLALVYFGVALVRIVISRLVWTFLSYMCIWPGVEARCARSS